jgi:hypothetical protein
MSIRPGISTTILRSNTIGTVSKVSTINPTTPLVYGRQHLSPSDIGSVS